jgi:hypothetical protein
MFLILRVTRILRWIPILNGVLGVAAAQLQAIEIKLWAHGPTVQKNLDLIGVRGALVITPALP